jgi:micrococcal nuclease
VPGRELISKSIGTWLQTASVILCLLILCPPGCAPPPDTAHVIQVIDGDTITITGGYRVRYIGIDAPETYPGVERYGIEAWLANRELVEGKKVRLEKDVSEADRYGRLLRYVYAGDMMVNAELVRLGLAEARAYPPDTRYQDRFERLENQAKRDGRGMWAD